MYAFCAVGSPALPPGKRSGHVMGFCEEIYWLLYECATNCSRMSSKPAAVLWQEESFKWINAIWRCRAAGASPPIYAGRSNTMKVRMLTLAAAAA